MSSQCGDIARRRFLRFLGASPILLSAGAAMAWRAAAQDAPAALIANPGEALNVFELQAVAAHRLPPAHYGYLQTGVLDDATVAANTRGYSKWGFRTRRLANIGKVDLSCRIFGETWASPVALSPLGSQRAFHQDGELASARAGRSRSALQMLSTLATTSIEDVVKARGAPVWFQVYPTDDMTVTKALVRRADAAGASAIVLTIDLLAGGMRRETMARMARLDTRQCTACHVPSSPDNVFPHRPMFENLDLSRVRDINNAALTWDYIARIREVTRKPLVVKGVMSADDAKLAVRKGVDGIMISNHGGRAEESLIGTIDVLPEVVAAVGARVPVIIDGGIRRGSDVFKALALGATAVGIGRPYIWGLGAFGQEGVEAAMRLIDEELAQAMQQAGTARLDDISRATVLRLS
jgi:4-hydroxymandelate oxidase